MRLHGHVISVMVCGKFPITIIFQPDTTSQLLLISHLFPSENTSAVTMITHVLYYIMKDTIFSEAYSRPANAAAERFLSNILNLKIIGLRYSVGIYAHIYICAVILLSSLLSE